MRTWLVLAAVLAVAVAAIADAVHGRLDRASEPAPLKVTPVSRVVPPGVPEGFMGTVYYSDPQDHCRLKTLRLSGFDNVAPPAYRSCRFSLSPDGTQVFGGNARWSPSGDIVAVPHGDRLALASPAAHQTVLISGRTPSFKPDGTLTYVLHGRLVEWITSCHSSNHRVTLPGDNGTARCIRNVWRGRPTSVVWVTNTRFAAITRDGEALLVDHGKTLVRAHVPRNRSPRLSVSPRRDYVSLWLDGELAGTFDASGGPVHFPPIAQVDALAWSPTERWAMVATLPGTVYLLRPGAGSQFRRLDIQARDIAWR